VSLLLILTALFKEAHIFRGKANAFLPYLIAFLLLKGLTGSMIIR